MDEKIQTQKTEVLNPEKKIEKSVETKVEKTEKIDVKPLPKTENSIKKTEEKTGEKKEEKSAESLKSEEEKPEIKPKTLKKETPKKEEAIARTTNLHVSMKQCKYICSFIKNKKIDQALSDLEKVKKFKIAVPFKGEIPHRKGKGIMSGRYPIKATTYLISTLKALKGNSIANGLELEKTIIFSASANWAARPLRRGNVQAKRTNIILKAKEVSLKTKK